jgi:hypothetical protein
VSRSIELLHGDQSIELILALAVLVVSVVSVGAVLIGNGSVWFTMSPRRAVEEIYASSLFGDTRDTAEFIRTNTTPGARIAVIGSEPEICFYARRRSATGHLYTYPLMEQHRYALNMQEEFIREIETNQPAYVVYVNNNLSWLVRPESEKRLFEWWPAYWATNLDLVRTINTRQGLEVREGFSTTAESTDPSNYLLLLKRKR